MTRDFLALLGGYGGDKKWFAVGQNLRHFLKKGVYTMNIILALIIAILVMIIGIEHDPNKEERSK